MLDHRQRGWAKIIPNVIFRWATFDSTCLLLIYNSLSMLISTFYHDIPGNSGLQHMIEKAENEWILQYSMSSKWVTVFSDMLNLRNQSSSCFFVKIYTSIHLFNFSYSILKPVDFYYIGFIWEWHALCCWWIHASHASLCYDISGTGTIRVKFMLQDSDGWCHILLSVQPVKCIL